MAESIVSDIIARVLEYMGHSVAQRIAPYFGGREKLNELHQTMMMIRARLFDAERRQEAEEGALIKSWLKELKCVMYKLEDLVEEVTVADTKNEQKASGKLTGLVCFLPSDIFLLRLNKRLSQKAQDIMKELDRISGNMGKFHFNAVSIHQERCALINMIIKRKETYSFTRDEEVIGRDDDKSAVIEMLLDSNLIGENFLVLSIVGMGGIGKTTVAQLIYNDEKVKQNFEYKFWVCIGDILSFRELIGKVLQSITGYNWQELSTDELQSRLRPAVQGKKFLLVLDDVWDEDRDKWLQLRSFLYGGKQGSKILVTSRSKVVASNMGTVEPYELKGLQEEKSWALFKSLAFKEGKGEMNPNLTRIGKEIVRKCGNVPLAIRTIAGILYSRDTEEEWAYFRDREFGMIELHENDIMPTVKLSYDHLSPQQKQCFAYCSVFPKDYKFEVQRLIWLWMAQGFVKSLDEGHACFMELLRRCFFQNVVRDVFDREICCQMHDLMHDLAKEVGGECLLVDGPREKNR